MAQHRVRAGMVIAGLCVGVAGIVLSPAGFSVVEAAELKLGYVNLGKLFDGYERTKASDATLEQKGKQKEAELEGRMNELNKIRQNLELLNSDAREAKSREVEEKADELQRFRTNTARDLRRERDKVAKEILREIQNGVEEYGKANGFTLILDDRSLVYGQPASNITAEVLKQLNGRLSQQPAGTPKR